jgi:hypothetical protein
MLFDVKVIVVAPGAVATEIWNKAEGLDVTRYRGTAYEPALQRLRQMMLKLGRRGFNPEILGTAIHLALTARCPKPRYQVTPVPVQDFLAQHLPSRWTDRMIAAQLGLSPR